MTRNSGKLGETRETPGQESALIEALGEPYKEYRQRTARLIPFMF